MTTTNFPNGLSSFGMPVLGPGSYPLSGHVFFVSSVAADGGADGNDGGYSSPMLTWDAAVGRCVANRGDVIYLMPGYTQTIAAADGVLMDIAGVTVIGLGNDADLPEITFATANGASIRITAANCSIRNVIGIGNRDGLTNPFHVQAAGCSLDILWRDTSAAIEAATVILTTAAADDLAIKLKYEGFTAGNACVSAIQLVGTADVNIDVDFYGICTTAVVELLSGTITNVKVTGNFYVSGITNLSRNVVDTVGGSTWTVQGFDGAAGASFSGGSGAAVASDDVSTINAKIGTITNTGGTATIGGVLGDVANVAVATNLAKIGTIVNTGGTATLGGVLGDVANVAVATNLAKIGTLVNTGGTATLGGILGDVANVAVATRLTTIDANQDKGVADAVTNDLMRDVVGDKADASVTEVGTTKSIEAYAKGLVSQMWAGPRCVEKSDGAVLLGDDPIFTIAGGPVHILSIVGIVTTVIGAGATNVKLELDTTEPVATVQMNAGAVDIDNDAAGTSYRSINTTSVFTPVTAGFVLEANSFATNNTTFLAPIGTIQFNSDAARTGVIKWYLTYEPLSPSSRVTAAA